MIHIKTEKEIEIMAKAGKILADVMYAVCDHAKVGITEIELDELAEKMIRERGGEPGFQKVPGYKHTVCMATNDVVVHGIPTKRVLKAGDVVGIDCGVYLQGFHSDMSETVRVQDSETGQNKEKDEIDRFIEVGKQALFDAIKQVKPGNHVGHISQTIQKIVEGNGYGVVRSLIGHGVGRELHEEPEIPGYLSKSIEKTPLLKEGMTIAVEIIYTMGKPDVVYANNDGWTIKTKDESLAGLFERTVAVTRNGYRILT